MPPSTHYLNFLNLNQAEERAHQTDYTNEDIAKELELFTNTNFLDTEPFFDQPFDAAAFDSHLIAAQQQQSIPVVYDAQKTRQPSVSTVPRNQRPQFQQLQHLPSQLSTPTTSESGTFSEQYPPTTTYQPSPASAKRSLEEAGLDYAASPAFTDDGSDEKRGGKSLDEEDKRRRNTAASARFRIKKKQREQALLESTKQMTDRNSALESRVKELEMENKWLRSLLKPVNAEQSKNVLASL